MKKIIGRKEYNTESATLIRKCTYGQFGDPAGYEEILFQTPDGFFFVYGLGGETSPYPAEDIVRISKAKVDQWLEEHL